MSLFTVDHQGFYLNGLPFYPLIQKERTPLESWSNAVVIELPAGLSQNLDWSSLQEAAKEVVSAGKYILWDLNLELPSFVWKPDDLLSFHAFSLAIEQFCTQIYPLFKDATLGVNFYRGRIDFSRQFPPFYWESSSENPDCYPLFCMELLSDYLHRLVSILPAEVLSFAFFDVSDYSSFSKVARLFLQKRFEYICLGLKGAKGPYPGICWEEGVASQGYCGERGVKEVKLNPLIGLFLPEDSLWNSSVLEEMEKTISRLQSSQISFRLIEEEKLTEQWDGLDEIIVISRSLVSVQAHRKFLGFIAAGGSIVYEDDKR